MPTPLTKLGAKAWCQHHLLEHSQDRALTGNKGLDYTPDGDPVATKTLGKL